MMIKFAFLICSFFFGFSAFAQPDSPSASGLIIKPSTRPDSVKTKTVVLKLLHQKMMISPDTLTLSDYTLSLERVNDNLNDIGDSAKLGFEVVKMSRRIGEMSEDIAQIRQNIRGRHAVFNIKNQYLYQSFTARLEDETDQIKGQIDDMYQRVYHAKLHLKEALADSVFRKLYADRELRTTFNLKLVQLERKYNRTDSLTKANVDTLNVMKVKESDNSYYLSNMLNVMDTRMDKAVTKLFGREVGYLWEPKANEIVTPEISKTQTSLFDSEKNAIGYYIGQTSGERKFILFFGILLFTWLFFKRKLLNTYRQQKGSFGDLHLKNLINHPFLSVLVFLLCLMPFFDAYAPVSYISIFYLLLLIASSVIFFRSKNSTFLFNWIMLFLFFVADVVSYLFIDPTLIGRVTLLVLHTGIVVFIYRFYKSLDKQMHFYILLKSASVTGIILSAAGVVLNLTGRFSLSGIAGLAGIFSVTQAAILTIFIQFLIEIILFQLQGRRIKRGINKSFDIEAVILKIKVPLIILAVLLWLIMLTSNLNIYHTINALVTDALTNTRTIGSISFQWLSVILFFAIIWIAHLLQRLLSFFFGETGIESDDIISKGQHSRLLITRLMVLIAGYLLAIAASGLPIDKLTFLLGALGIGIGMGLQNIVNNFVSGIILIFDGSLQIGDEIEVSGQAGKVKEIGLRTSTLSTSDGADVIIPNGNILSQNIVNWTFSNNEKRILLSFSLKGEELDANVINEVINNTVSELPNLIQKMKPVILFTKVTPESCELTIRFWSTVQNVDQIKSEAMLRLYAAFAKKNISFN